MCQVLRTDTDRDEVRLVDAHLLVFEEFSIAFCLCVLMMLGCLFTRFLVNEGFINELGNLFLPSNFSLLFELFRAGEILLFGDSLLLYHLFVTLDALRFIELLQPEKSLLIDHFLVLNLMSFVQLLGLRRGSLVITVFLLNSYQELIDLLLPDYLSAFCDIRAI